MIYNLLICPLFVFILLILFTPARFVKLLHTFSIIGTGIPLIAASWCMSHYDLSSSGYQYVQILDFASNYSFLKIGFGLDGIGVLFLFLTTVLFFLCSIYLVDESKESLKLVLASFLFLEVCLIVVFSTTDAGLFYIFFEAILIPMLFIIGTGRRERKVWAAWLLFFYTLITSLIFLVGLVFIYNLVGSLQFEVIASWKFTKEQQMWLWMAFFLSFASKIPMVPFHIWLPEAHVEAPTIGSVILAGILLKIGVYGLVRFNFVFCPEANIYFTPIIVILGCIGAVWAGYSAILQRDLKRVIAYSSVSHMSVVVIGLYTGSEGFQGAIVQCVAHGFTSGALFFLIGMLYKRYHSRFMDYYSGLVYVMPIYTSFFLIFTLANIAFPGTSNFIGESLLLLGVFKENNDIACLTATTVIISSVYSLWSYNRPFFGALKNNHLLFYRDLSLPEIFILTVLVLLTIYTGFSPSYFLQYGMGIFSTWFN